MNKNFNKINKKINQNLKLNIEFLVAFLTKADKTTFMIQDIIKKSLKLNQNYLLQAELQI